jgi:hypothetical protein
VNKIPVIKCFSKYDSKEALLAEVYRLSNELNVLKQHISALIKAADGVSL